MFRRSFQRVSVLPVVVILAVWLAGLAPIAVASPAGLDAEVTGDLGSDFNGDGYADLAVGVPDERIGGTYSAGAVNVIYGSDRGLLPAGNQLWTQDSAGIPEEVDGEDMFGRGLAAGDFDGDGYDDLAVGAALDAVGAVRRAGVLHVIFGSATGLTADGTQLWTQDTPGVSDRAEEGDLFGDVLATGDMDADGYADLAMGVAGEDIGGRENAGAVQVFYGSGGGPTADGDQRWTQDSDQIADAAEAWDEFGIALAIERFNDDAFADLAVGAPFEQLPGGAEGAAAVLYGSAAGITAAGNQLWSQDSAGIQGQGEPGEHFALVLSSGDFDGDQIADLVAGVPHDAVADLPGGGAVNVLYGSSTGITAKGDQRWSQDSPGIADIADCVSSEESWCDLFGWSVGAGDFDGDGFDELVIGVPGEDLAGDDPRKHDQGLVQVIHGSPAGLVSTGDRRWSQDSSGVKGAAEVDDRFGWTMVADRFGTGIEDDLAVSAAWDDIGDEGAAGVVNVLYGSGTGLASKGNQLWSQDHPGILGRSESSDKFGLRLTAGGYPA